MKESTTVDVQLHCTIKNIYIFKSIISAVLEIEAITLMQAWTITSSKGAPSPPQHHPYPSSSCQGSLTWPGAGAELQGEVGMEQAPRGMGKGLMLPTTDRSLLGWPSQTCRWKGSAGLCCLGVPSHGLLGEVWDHLGRRCCCGCGGREGMAYAQHVLKVLGYFNPLYDPLGKRLRPSDPAREFYRGKCLKLLHMLLQKLCPLPGHSFVQ